MLNAVRSTAERIDRLEAALVEIVPAWKMGPVVAAFQATRGFGFLTATTLVAEAGDIRRFDHPRQLMAFLGLVPSERSTGETRRQGGPQWQPTAIARELAASCGRLRATSSRRLSNPQEHSLRYATLERRLQAQPELLCKAGDGATVGNSRRRFEAGHEPTPVVRQGPAPDGNRTGGIQPAHQRRSTDVQRSLLLPCRPASLPLATQFAGVGKVMPSLLAVLQTASVCSLVSLLATMGASNHDAGPSGGMAADAVRQAAVSNPGAISRSARWGSRR